MRVDEHGQHAQRLVVLDEAHPAHVGGEVVDVLGTCQRFRAGLLENVRSRNHVLSGVVDLVPLVEGLEIDHPDFAALIQQIEDEMTSDEASAACNYNQFTAHLDLHASGRLVDCFDDTSRKTKIRLLHEDPSLARTHC